MGTPLHNKEITHTGRVVAKKRIYTIFVVASDDDTWKIYHCPDCRNAIFQYKGDLVREMPGLVESKCPVLTQCKNPNCGRKVQVNGEVGQI